MSGFPSLSPTPSADLRSTSYIVMQPPLSLLVQALPAVSPAAIAQIEAHRRMASQRRFTRRKVPWQHNGGRPIVLKKKANPCS